MVIKSFVKMRGDRLPKVNTPLSNDEIHYLKDNYDRYILCNVSSGACRIINSDRPVKRYKIDIGYKPAFALFFSCFGLYQYYKTKKKIKEAVSRVNPLSPIPDNKEWTETVNNWSIREENEEELPAEA